jgi:Tol biopolymer transport system component
VVRYLLTLTVAVAWAADPGAPRTWLSGPQVTLLGSPSRDGRWISYADPVSGALAMRSLADGGTRTVATRPAGSREFAHFSVISRDGGQIAYDWFNAQGFYELRVSRVSESAAPAIVYRNEVAGFVQPCSWTPDNRYVLTLLFRRDNISQIALIPAAGGAPRVLRSLNWVYPKRMDVSPDGRWIVYDNFAAEGKPERTIFLLAADGSTEKRLVEAAGNYLFPMWSANGRRVLFAGETDGQMDLWAADVDAGAPRGAPYRVSGGLGRILPLGITNSDEVFYGVRTGVQDISAGGGPIRTRFAGRNSAPAWSREGRWLAYLSRRGTENFGEDVRALVVQEIATGGEREVAARMAHIERVVWSPDGSGLLAAGSDGKGRSGLFLVRARDGVTVPLAAEHDAPFRGWEGVWASDGTAVYCQCAGPTNCGPLGGGWGERTILRTGGMRHLAINPAGSVLAGCTETRCGHAGRPWRRSAADSILRSSPSWPGGKKCTPDAVPSCGAYRSMEANRYAYRRRRTDSRVSLSARMGIRWRSRMVTRTRRCDHSRRQSRPAGLGRHRRRRDAADPDGIGRLSARTRRESPDPS